MEIKKIVKCLVLSAFVILLTGCKSNVACTKEEENEYYKYSVTLNLTFDSDDVINKIESNAKYTLTDKGKENKETFTSSLEEKNERYKNNDKVKVNYNVTDNDITISEIIDLGDTKASDYPDLSASYISDKISKDDILELLKNTGLTCK